MKILLLCGSLRKGSFNKAIINFLAKQCNQEENTEGTIYTDLHLIPPFTPDLDIHDLNQDHSPKYVKELRSAIKSSDAVIISTPEYAFQIPGVLKNALDWLVSSGEFVDKPTMVISASPSYAGADCANAVLVKLLGTLSAKVIHDKPLNIARVNKKIDTNGELFDSELIHLMSGSLKVLYNTK